MLHDACGVGFIARTIRSSRDTPDDRAIVRHGLTALRRLTHRGAPASLGAVDGCGLLTAIPWTMLDDVFGGLPGGRTRALGMLFVHPADRDAAIALVETELRTAGATTLAWRRVP